MRPAMETSKGPAFPNESVSADPYRSPVVQRSSAGAPMIIQVVLRSLAAVCAFIAMAVIASFKAQVIEGITYGGFYVTGTSTIGSYFFLCFMLAIDVLTVVYAIVTLVLSVCLLNKATAAKGLLFGVFTLDLIFCCLLISSGTSAATGTRIVFSNAGKAYASTAFTFLAFFTLVPATLLSGIRAGRD